MPVTHQCFSSCWTAFAQHQAPTPVIRQGVCKRLGGNWTMQMTQITKRDIPCQVISWLVVKCRRACLESLVVLHMGTGWVSAYLWEVVIDCVCITCPVSSSLSFFFYFCFLNYLYHYPWVFWLLLWLYSPVTLEARVGKNKQAAVIQSCLQGWTHKNVKQNRFREVPRAIGSLSMLNPLNLFFFWII